MKSLDLLFEKKKHEINTSALSKEEKKKMNDILGVKKNLYKKGTIGIPTNFFEENWIKKMYPDFYKKKVTKKGKYKNGLPKNPYAWLPRS